MLHVRLAGIVVAAAWLGCGGAAMLPAQSAPVRLPPLEDESWETSRALVEPASAVVSSIEGPAAQDLAPPTDELIAPETVAPPPSSSLPPDSLAPPPEQLPQSITGPPAAGPQPVVQGPWTTGMIGGGGAMGAGMMGRGPLIGGNVHGAWYAAERVSGQSATLGYEQEQFGIIAPMYKGKKSMLFFHGNLASEQVSTTAILPTSLRAFPNQLWTVNAGVGGMRKFDNGWTAMANIAIGSASDRPFSAGTSTVSFMMMLRVPRGQRNAWQFSLMYANNSPLPIPIPGVAYAYSPSPRLFMMIGLPPSIVYRPTDDIVLEAMYMPFFTVHTRATYIFSPTWRFFGGFDWENQTWFLSDRTVQNDRFYYFDKRLSAGAQHLLSKHWVIDFSSGYLFNRYFFQATSFTAAVQTDRVDVGAGPYAALFLNARY